MEVITSRSNELIKHIASLQQAKHRKEHNQFVAEGMRVCSTFISAGYMPKYILTTNPNEINFSLRKQAQTIEVPVSVMEKVSTLTSPSSLLCVFVIPHHDVKELQGPGIVLAGISDPGNAGTLIRTAAALNIKTIIAVESVDFYNPKTIQASAGTLALVKIYALSWDEFIAAKQDNKLYALVVQSGKAPQSLPQESFLVIGSEAHGIPDAWVQQCDEKISIPMPGGTESLNAAVAGSIALYLSYSK